jgi:3',5'-cyclic AMP phosphodiesterase CpdA
MRTLLCSLGLAGLACTGSFREAVETDDEASGSSSGSEGESSTALESESSSESETAGASANGFRVVVFGDLHIVPPDWRGSDPALADASLRLAQLREQVAAIDPPPDFAIVLGDLVHDAYASADPDWYIDNQSAFGLVAAALAEFPVPVYPLFGEHDYGLPEIGRPVSHQIFAQTFARAPYYAIDHGGWRFVFANTQLGPTFEPANVDFDPSTGSLGQAQLDWIAQQLDDGTPSVLLMHFPLFQQTPDEATEPYTDLPTLIAANDDVRLALAAHSHQWNSLPRNYAAPHVVFGPAYLDSDNFLLIEFAELGSYEILDAGKVQWGSAEADTWVYQGTPVPGN